MSGVTLSQIPRKLFQDKNGRLVIFQRPNVPIILWAVSTLFGMFFNSGWLGAALNIIAFVSLSVWALLELFYGVNLFRRLLGLIVLFVVTAAHFFQ